MINSNFVLGYDPKCKLYQREQTKGRKMWYIDYYLPNNVRMQRPIHKVKKEADRLKNLKQKQLYLEVFDSKDKEKLKGFFPLEKERMKIETVLNLYFEVTGPSKSPNTFYNDWKCCDNYFRYFTEAGREYFDEITTLDIQLFINHLDSDGKAEATMIHALKSVKKVFRWAINIVELMDIKNPADKPFTIPEKNGDVRDYLPKDEEISALLNVTEATPKNFGCYSPTKNIVSFLIHTGCRLGEALHLEWKDINLKSGIWTIKAKSDCLTRFGKAWQSKSGKRTVPLTKGALDLLNSLEKVDSVGYVAIRGKDGKITGHKKFPANFVFPKVSFVEVNGLKTKVYSRVDNVNTAWNTLRERLGMSNLQLKDLRTYFNYKLIHQYGFTAKEAGCYIGNSEKINEKHYTPVEEEAIRVKLSLSKLGLPKVG